MSAALKARLSRLEKRHKAATGKPKGVIGGRFNGTYVEEVEGVLYLRREELPGGFEVFARNQQNALQAELRTILGNDAPQAKAPNNVGTVANNPAPLKPGQKQPNFVHLADGTEIPINRKPNGPS